ncbi:hypothetical protein SprV_0100268700 [Sparganum proliferum]
MCSHVTTRPALLTVLYCLLFVSFGQVADAPSSPSPPSARRINCDLQQKGYHLKLKCSLLPDSGGDWDQCSIQLDLSRGIYANPYELTDRLPEVKFNITRKASRESSWFARTFLATNEVEEVTSVQELALRPSKVDVEAPEWRSEALRWKFLLSSPGGRHRGSDAALELNIPLHLRYSVPSPTGMPDSKKVEKPKLVCSNRRRHSDALGGTIEDDLGSVNEEEEEVADAGDGESSIVRTNHGCSSDLLLVMPLTVLFLVIGIVVLLLG